MKTISQKRYEQAKGRDKCITILIDVDAEIDPDLPSWQNQMFMDALYNCLKKSYPDASVQNLRASEFGTYWRVRGNDGGTVYFSVGESETDAAWDVVREFGDVEPKRWEWWKYGIDDYGIDTTF